MSLIQFGQDMANLGGIVPISRHQTELFSRQFANILDRKWLVFVEIVEHIYYFKQLGLGGHLSMSSNHLCEGHLPNSDHASPSSICYISS